MHARKLPVKKLRQLSADAVRTTGTKAASGTRHAAPAPVGVATAGRSALRKRLALRFSRYCRLPFRRLGAIALLMLLVAVCLVFLTSPHSASTAVQSLFGGPLNLLPWPGGLHSRPGGSVYYSRKQLNRLPRYAFTADEARDIYLLRPNWRAADEAPSPYVFRRGRGMEEEDDDEFVDDARGELLTSRFVFQRREHSSRTAGGEDAGGGLTNLSHESQLTLREGKVHADKIGKFYETDPDTIRVLIVLFTNRMDVHLCAAVATAYLSGLPVVVLGYQHVWANFTDKHFAVQAAGRRAGLQPHDIILCLDSDVLFFSGRDLVRTVDRFIRYSPQSASELDVRAVRDDHGGMMAPVLFSTEKKCMYKDFLGIRTRSGCVKGFRERGMADFDAYMRKTFPTPGDYQPWGQYTFRFLNAGAIMARVWAHDELVRGIHNVAHRKLRMPGVAARSARGKWKCDQSISALLYLSSLKHEVQLDIFASVAAEKAVGNEEDEEEQQQQQGGDPTTMTAKPMQDRLRELQQPGPYGIRPGLIGLNHHAEFITTVTQSAFYQFLNDRYWLMQATASMPAGERRGAGNGDALQGVGADGELAAVVTRMAQKQSVRYWRLLEAETDALVSLSFLPKHQWVAQMGRHPPHINGDGGGEGNAKPATTTTAASLDPFTLEVSRLYFARRTTRYDGWSKGRSGGVFRDATGVESRSHIISLPIRPFEGHCLGEAMYRASVGDIAEDTVAALANTSLSVINAKKAARALLRLQNAATAHPMSLTAAPSPPSFSAALSPLPNASTLSRCFDFPKEADDRDCVLCASVDWFAQPRHRASAAAVAVAEPFLFTSRPLYLSRHAEVKSILVAPPVVGVDLFLTDGQYERRLRRFAAASRNGKKHTRREGKEPLREYQFSPIMHSAGRVKNWFRPLILPFAPWSVPLFYSFDGNGTSGPEDGFTAVRAFLHAMPIELWGEGIRERKPLTDVCGAHVEELFMDRRERAKRKPWPHAG